jgi:hypothetical protein
MSVSEIFSGESTNFLRKRVINTAPAVWFIYSMCINCNPIYCCHNWCEENCAGQLVEVTGEGRERL